MKRTVAAGKSAREEVQRALMQWKAAMRFYENISEPELIDYAIYEMEAARRKYVFLLKKGGGDAADC